MTKIVKVAKTKFAKIQIHISQELVARLIKQGRKTAAVNHYQELAGAKAAEAMAVDAQNLCEKTSIALEKATTDVARENAVISLLDNARALSFKSSVKFAKPEKAEKATKVKAEKAEKVTKVKSEKATKVAKAEKAEKATKVSKAEKAEKATKVSKAEKLANTEVAKPKKLKIKAELENSSSKIKKLKKMKKNA